MVLTVGWANLTTKLLRRLMEVIVDRKMQEICDLNLSYNALNLAAKDGGECEDAKIFFEKLKEFLHKSDAITHLELSGM